MFIFLVWGYGCNPIGIDYAIVAVKECQMHNYVKYLKNGDICKIMLMCISNLFLNIISFQNKPNIQNLFKTLNGILTKTIAFTKCISSFGSCVIN